MTTTSPDVSMQLRSELDDVLAKAETALLTPVISGELESWAKNVLEAAGGLSQKLPSFLRNVMHPLYKQIAKEDAELLTRVEQLVADDRQLLDEQAAFEQLAIAFAKRAAEVKKDEAQAESDRARLEHAGIALILHIKRQRAAADTWLAEANYRDRGPVD